MSSRPMRFGYTFPACSLTAGEKCTDEAVDQPLRHGEADRTGVKNARGEEDLPLGLGA